ncbi:hypothetical protein TSUD_304620 [Trifolium subterraneum]|uniref:ubiquitinyl hydrolase 1 n=2 Tax=Trifolium TaxID=3898 RepID=A0A2Z6N3H8_TRISU|nr:hypothetical protein TSUD_304620 [Trifolium subterraneum]
MHVTEDLGFFNLVLVVVVCVIFPVIGFIIRRKWKLAVARNEEIKRLLILAAEETARVERESSFPYVSAPVVSAVTSNYQCALCYFPATARCAQCKSVRYCSTHCQTVHWRQGHKFECRPPNKTHQNDDIISDIGKREVEQDYSGIHEEKSESRGTEHKISSEDTRFSPEVSPRKDDNVRARFLAEENLADSNSEFSSNSFSGFSASTSSNDSSDDSSVSGSRKEERKLASNGISGSNTWKGVKTAPSGFWDEALDSGGIKVDVNNDIHQIHSDESTCEKNDSGLSELPLYSSSSQSSNIGKDSSFVDATSIHNFKSFSSVASNHVVDNHGCTLKSTDIRGQTREVVDSKLASTTERNSHPSTKHRNGEYGTVTSHVANYSANSKSGLKTSVLKVVDQFRGSNLSKHISLAVGSDIAGKYSDKVLFPYESFVKLYNYNKVELHPFGLINCGNSCYANAVLQCLAFTPSLTAYLLQGLHSKSCVNKKWCFTCEFERLIMKSKDTKSALSPMSILSQLQSIGSQLGNGKEEDAHEFLRHAIDTMQSVCLMEAGVNASGSLEDTTLMGQTFGGYLRSKIKCMKCGGKSERHERMMDLTVEIEGEISTLAEALRRFTSTESLDGENKYHCVRCKSYEKAKKKLTVSEAPNILTVALKRFQSGKFGKLNKPIQFPEILDLAPFMSGTSDKTPIYRLYGVVVHLDIMNAAFSGHYVCYVKNIQNKWFKVDDSVVTAVDLERVMTKGAYMLFYARCSPRAPKIIRNRILSRDSKSKVNEKSMKAKYMSSNSGAVEPISSSISPDGSPTLESFYSRFHHLKKVLEEDLSSDNSSLFSSNSDEGSCSTDSTRDSTSMDDFSDYIFGDSGHGWSSTWRNSDSDTSSSSSSPLNYRHSPLSDMDKYDSMSPDATSLRIPTGSSAETDRGGGFSHLHSNTILQHRKLDSNISSNSSSRDADSFLKLGSNHSNDKNSGVSCRKSRKRTD